MYFIVLLLLVGAVAQPYALDRLSCSACGACFEVAAVRLFICFRQLNGRPPPGARQATAALPPPVRASFRSAASSPQKPPMYSLVSVYGPSVTSTFPLGC